MFRSMEFAGQLPPHRAEGSSPAVAEPGPSDSKGHLVDAKDWPSAWKPCCFFRVDDGLKIVG